MDTDIPRRRGRPPNAIADPTPETVQDAPETGATAPKRRRRASVGGHKAKLYAPQRPGYVRRFVNDDGNSIAEREELAYTHVSERGIATDDPGSRTKRLAGTKANGEPLFTYLMETPESEYQAGVDERESKHAELDKAIIGGSAFADAADANFAHARRGSIQVGR